MASFTAASVASARVTPPRFGGKQRSRCKVLQCAAGLGARPSSPRGVTGLGARPSFPLGVAGLGARPSSPVAAGGSARLPAPKAAAPSANKATEVSPAQLRKERTWGLWWQLPVPATSIRPTLRAELVAGEVWGFDQLQGTLKIFINSRMTVVRLAEGGLFVNNPVAPTYECLRLLHELEDKFGPVKYIALSSVALEHKAYLKPFAQKFPSASVWVAPGQWSFPVNIPIAASLWPVKVAGEIADSDSEAGAVAPWVGELEAKVLGVGGSTYTGFEDPWFVDVAWYHKRSKTVLVTDSVLQVPTDPVPVCAVDPEPLLLRSNDEPGMGVAEDTPANRRRGWWKVCLFATFVAPSTQTRENLAWDGFRWEEGWESTFTCFAGRLLVHPILRVLCFNRRPEDVLAWADRVADWDIKRVIPAHFEAPIKCNGKDFRNAFKFLQEDEVAAPGGGSPLRALFGAAAAAGLGDPVFPEEELSYLRQLDADTVKQGTSEPPKVYRGGVARIED